VLGLIGSVPIVVILIAGVCAPLAGWVAMQRTRNPIIWFVYGALTGPLAILLLYAAPPGRCPECDHAIQGWPSACPACGRRFATIGSAWGPAPAGRPRTTMARTVTQTSTSADRPVQTRPQVPRPQALAPSWSTPRTAVGPAGSRRPPAVSQSPVATSPSEVVLATGIYVSGNTGMEIGALYAIARVDDRIRIFGPVDLGQLTVRVERPLAETEVAALDDRIVISIQHGRSTTSVVMRAVGGMRAAELEGALAAGGAPDDSGRDRP